MPKKRSAELITNSDGSDAEVAPKSAKKTKGAADGPASSVKDDDGNPYWELSKMRRVGVSQFKNMSFVNIREYYEKDGKTLPGKKGIALSVEQYTALLKAIPSINAALSDLGHPIETQDATTSTALVTKPKPAKTKSGKANIDTTSDEEDEE